MTQTHIHRLNKYLIILDTFYVDININSDAPYIIVGSHYDTDINIFGGLLFGPIKGLFFVYNIIRHILFFPYVSFTVKVRPCVRYLDLVIRRQYKRTNALIRLYYYDMTTSWDVIVTGLYSFYNRLNFNHPGHRLFRFISV